MMLGVKTQGGNGMENSTAESVLEKTFDHLDKIIKEKKQDKSSEADMHSETADSQEQTPDKAREMLSANDK